MAGLGLILRFRGLVILEAKLELLHSIVVLSLVTRQCRLYDYNQQAQKLYVMESVGLGKVFPGAVNDGGCTFSQGYYENRAFIVSPPNTVEHSARVSVFSRYMPPGPMS